MPAGKIKRVMPTSSSDQLFPGLDVSRLLEVVSAEHRGKLQDAVTCGGCAANLR